MAKDTIPVRMDSILAERIRDMAKARGETQAKLVQDLLKVGIKVIENIPIDEAYILAAQAKGIIGPTPAQPPPEVDRKIGFTQKRNNSITAKTKAIVK